MQAHHRRKPQHRECEEKQFSACFQKGCHTDWVSSVRFAPGNAEIVSVGWDMVVKVWNLNNCNLKNDHLGHTGYINTVTVSPDGSICASGGKVCLPMSCVNPIAQ